MPVELAAPPALCVHAWDLAQQLARPQVYDSFYLAVAADAQCWAAS